MGSTGGGSEYRVASASMRARSTGFVRPARARAACAAMFAAFVRSVCAARLMWGPSAMPAPQ